jgi:hypothetical protein
MKTRLTVLAASVLFISSLLPSAAQIPNAGFEQWTLGQPDGWFTDNIAGFATPITQSTTKHSGSFALRGEVVLFAASTYPPLLIAGLDGMGFPVSKQHAALKGYYQYSPVSGDELTVGVLMYRQKSAIGAGSITITAASATFTQFTVDILYQEGQVPDSCVIVVAISGVGSADPHVGSAMILDDLEFSDTGTSVQEYARSQNAGRYALGQNYPNPFNPVCTIDYTVPEPSDVTVAVYDIMGREAAVLFRGTNAPGVYDVQFQPGQLPSGVYFYRMTAKSLVTGKTFSEMKKATYVK